SRTTRRSFSCATCLSLTPSGRTVSLASPGNLNFPLHTRAIRTFPFARRLALNTNAIMRESLSFVVRYTSAVRSSECEHSDLPGIPSVPPGQFPAAPSGHKRLRFALLLATSQLDQ